jgi:hypothetical protein
VMIWSLKVEMARSAVLQQWMCGGTNWKATNCERMNCLSLPGASLSRMLSSALSPRETKRAWILLQAQTSSVSWSWSRVHRRP